ncbi:MAG TPA: GNAT family N-acetyltransferase [Pseudonocardiaceae bacterium]|nr:GNAT family N-acetyltransferase [Pseudonocardiaceae bacterium]
MGSRRPDLYLRNPHGEPRHARRTIDVQLRQPYATQEQANLAFGLYPAWRGRGLATRAVLLAIRFLHERTNIEQALIRVDPANTASSAVARRAGFRLAETTFQAERVNSTGSSATSPN